ncbi:MAG TPA: dipeptidase [Verrucomicrobiae bacterium]|nr:dipeptidase [Verrucomicrobiae bacterium]
MPEPRPLRHAREASPLPVYDPSAAQLDVAREILKDSPIIDGHNDTPWQFRKRGNDMTAIDLATNTSGLKMVTDIPRLRAGCVGGQFWSVYIPSTMGGSIAVHAVLEQIDVVHEMVARWPDTFELALTADDIERIERKGKIASLIGMEGGHSIDNSLAILRMTYALGARYMTLTHVKNTDWADSANDEPKHHGLTPFGEDVIREMNRLGMMVDLSHVSAETMQAVLKISKAPVIFSHSSARALCDNPRNVPDEILRQMPTNGGIVMINFFPEYLNERANQHLTAQKHEWERLGKLYPDNTNQVRALMKEWKAAHPMPHLATLNDVADHIDYVRKVAGIDYVGIGSDFEGFDGPPDGLEDVSCYPALMAELLRRGYTPDDVKKVSGRNLLRVFRQVEKVAAQSQHESQR